MINAVYPLPLPCSLEPKLKAHHYIDTSLLLPMHVFLLGVPALPCREQRVLSNRGERGRIPPLLLYLLLPAGEQAAVSSGLRCSTHRW